MVIAHIELCAFLFSAARTLITYLKVMQVCELDPVHVAQELRIRHTMKNAVSCQPAVLSFRSRCQRFLFVILGTVRSWQGISDLQMPSEV